MKIYFVRHGQTQENADGLIIGVKANPSLNDFGVQQVKELKLDSDFDVIFSSPMKRCLQTAEIINQMLKKQIVVSQGLIERSKGDLEMHHESEVEALTNGVINKEMGSRLEIDFSPWGGDSIEKMRNQVNSFIEELQRNHKDKKVLVVGHLGVLKVLRAIHTNNPPINMENTALNILEI